MNIGDRLYRHVSMSGIWEYIVVGIHQYEGCQQYVVEAQACTHGWKCKLLIADDGRGVLRFVSLLNDDKDDSQHCWHTDNTAFWPNKYEAHKECYRKMLTESARDLRDLEAALEQKKKRHAEIEEALKLATGNAEKLQEQTP